MQFDYVVGIYMNLTFREYISHKKQSQHPALESMSLIQTHPSLTANLIAVVVHHVLVQRLDANN